jgi:Effector-associated domain 2
MVRPAESRTILLVDVERFGDHNRKDPHRVTVRDGLYSMLEKAIHGTGISWDICYREDRGDGVMILVPANVHKILFAESLPGLLADELRRYNQHHPEQERIRLRMALHAGEVFFDDNGVTSNDVNLAFRLLDAEPLREALRDSPGVVALIASSWFYYRVIQNSASFPAQSYSPVLIDSKEVRTVAWITIPGLPEPVSSYARNEPWRIRLRDSGGRVHGPGIMLCGRYAITSAHVAAGALRLPSQDPAAMPSGQVFFDVPARPTMDLQRAELILWRPALPVGGDPAGLGLAGLSIVGPAIRGIEEPVLGFDLGPGERIVRLRACADDGQARLPVWARLPEHSANGGEPVQLNRLSDDEPGITSECHGSDVIDERTGKILGIATVIAAGGSRDYSWLTPIGSIADEWPLLSRIATQGEHGISNHIRSRAFSRSDILRLAAKSLQIPALAEARSRHMIVSELPVEVVLTAPRSSIDRADLTSLLWACARAPWALIELAEKIRESSPGGRKATELANDLERFHARLLPKSLSYATLSCSRG